MPLVSVIIPAYNAEQYIASSIESVLNQTFSDFELIIINDGSTDNTLEVINQFSKTDKRINVISQKNQGVSVARNAGINIATSEYIAFLDSDDLYLDSFLERMTSKIMSEKCDAVYCGYKNMRDNIEQGLPYTEGNILECYALKNLHIWIVAFIIKKKFLEQNNIQFTPGVTMGEDQEFILSCGISCQMKSVPEVLAVYQYNPNSASNTLSFKKRKEDILARDRVLEQIKQKFTSIYKKEVISHLQSLRDDIMLSSKRIIWKEIRQGKFDSALTKINEFGHFENVETKKKCQRRIEVAIINSRNIFLWHMIRSLKVLEMMITGKYKK